MSGRWVLGTSLALNVALLGMGSVVWRQAAQQRAAHAALTVALDQAPEPETVSAPVAAAAPPDSTPPAPAPGFHWSRIESTDYRQYIANLRAVGCPERLIRDIIVADIEALYRSRLAYRSPPRDPWVSRDRRSAETAAAERARTAAGREKRLLIRELLGCDWDAEFADDWLTHPEIALLSGFLPETKIMQLAAIFKDHEDERSAIERAANQILLAEDKARIRAVREGMVAALRAVLTPAELEEAQLRVQLAGGFPDGLHLEGVELAATELRDLARASLAYQDVILEELLDMDEEVTDEERQERRLAFERVVEQRLGTARYADYQRAQASEFRQLYEFANENNLTRNHAVQAYDYWRGAMAEAEALASDPTLSATDRTTAAAVLRQTMTDRFRGLLATSALPEFVDRWTEQMAATIQAGPPQNGQAEGQE